MRPARARPMPMRSRCASRGWWRGHCIVQAAVFESEDPAFAGEMQISWRFEPADDGQHTRVTVRCEDVPSGIGEEDHQAGLRSTLENLAAFVESPGS